MQPAKVLEGFQDCELVVEGNLLGHVAKMMTRFWFLAQYLYQTTVELPPPNNNREETGLPTPTCPQETIYLPFLCCEIEAVQHLGPGTRVGKCGSPDKYYWLTRVLFIHL